MPVSQFSKGPRGPQTAQSEAGVPKLIEHEPCQSCGSTNIHRSKARSLFERVRKLQTTLRPFQCHDCGWRAWLMPLQFVGQAEAPSEPVLTALDREFERAMRGRTAPASTSAAPENEPA